jgi:hypothetical protein
MASSLSVARKRGQGSSYIFGRCSGQRNLHLYFRLCYAAPRIAQRGGDVQPEGFVCLRDASVVVPRSPRAARAGGRGLRVLPDPYGGGPKALAYALNRAEGASGGLPQDVREWHVDGRV